MPPLPPHRPSRPDSWMAESRGRSCAIPAPAAGSSTGCASWAAAACPWNPACHRGQPLHSADTLHRRAASDPWHDRCTAEAGHAKRRCRCSRSRSRGPQRPVPLPGLALAPAALAVKVGAELDVGIEDDVVTELRVLEDLEQVELAQRVPSDGRMQRGCKRRSRA